MARRKQRTISLAFLPLVCLRRRARQLEMHRLLSRAAVGWQRVFHARGGAEKSGSKWSSSALAFCSIVREAPEKVTTGKSQKTKN